MFAGRPSKEIVANVRSLYQRIDPRVTRIGYVYAFWDFNDPPTTVKIGSTRRRPQKRIAEWRNSLYGPLLIDDDGADQKPSSLTMLFAYHCMDARAAEAIVHGILACSRISDRVNVATGEYLTEYFIVPASLRRVKMLVDQVCRHVNFDFYSHLHRTRSAGTKFYISP